MKKLLGILVLSLLWCNVGFAKNFKAMSKCVSDDTTKTWEAYTGGDLESSELYIDTDRNKITYIEIYTPKAAQEDLELSIKMYNDAKNKTNKDDVDKYTLAQGYPSLNRYAEKKVWDITFIAGDTAEGVNNDKLDINWKQKVIVDLRNKEYTDMESVAGHPWRSYKYICQ